MSQEIARLFAEPKSSRFAEVCRHRVGMAAVAVSILFLAVLVVAL